MSVLRDSRLPCIDALRFIAATIVIIDHGGIKFSAGDGVQFFLILSGFLFTWLFCIEWEKTKTLDVRRFFLRRFMRLMPAFWCARAFTVIAKGALGLPIDWAHLSSVLFFYGNYYNAFNHHPHTGFDIYWTLSLQEQFYLVWPWAFLFLIRRGKRAAWGVVLGAIATVCLYRSYLFYSGLVDSSYLYNAFELRVDSMLMGALAALFVRYFMSDKHVAIIQSRPWLPFLFIGLLTLYRIYIAPSYRYGWGYTLHAAIIAMLMVQLMLLAKHRYWSWLESPVICFGGLISYSMYLYHGWGLALGGRFTGLPLIGRIAVGFVVTVALAIPSYYLVERTGMRLRKK